MSMKQNIISKMVNWLFDLTDLVWPYQTLTPILTKIFRANMLVGYNASRLCEREIHLLRHFSYDAVNVNCSNRYNINSSSYCLVKSCSMARMAGKGFNITHLDPFWFKWPLNLTNHIIDLLLENCSRWSRQYSFITNSKMGWCSKTGCIHVRNYSMESGCFSQSLSHCNTRDWMCRIYVWQRYIIFL